MHSELKDASAKHDSMALEPGTSCIHVGQHPLLTVSGVCFKTEKMRRRGKTQLLDSAAGCSVGLMHHGIDHRHRYNAMHLRLRFGH